MAPFAANHRHALRPRQAGLTLVELMVALTIGMLLAAAAVAALIVARQGFTSVDSSTELRENGRLAARLIQRIADQGGFQDMAGGQFYNASSSAALTNTVQGFDNAMILPAPPAALPANLPATLAHGTRTSSNCGAYTDTTCMNGSDILILRYWGVSTPPGPPNPADGSMINCSGATEPERAAGPSYSIFSVATSASGEPTLACTYQDSTGAWQTAPLVTGVEAFQVLYGTTGVTAGVCSAAPDPVAAGAPMDTYLTATQLDGPSGYCANNWARVRMLRIGILMRGGLSTAVSPPTAAASWPVLSAPGATYSFSTGTDVGSTLTVQPDSRLRQQMVFTIKLQNIQMNRPQ
jgi:type IV pilus assembly protein PilW